MEYPSPQDDSAEPEPEAPPLTRAERRAELVHYTGLTEWQVAVCAGLPALLFLVLLLTGGEGRSGVSIAVTYTPIPVLVFVCQAASRRLGWGRFLGGVLLSASIKMVLTAGMAMFFILRHAQR